MIVLDSALRTFVLPRGAVVRLTRLVSVVVRKVFDFPTRWAKTYEGRDRAMALYGPVSMFVLVILWMVLVLTGFMLIFMGVEQVGWKEGLHPERLVDVHAGLRTADRLLGRDARVRRSRDRARAARAVDRLPPDDLRRVLAP